MTLGWIGIGDPGHGEALWSILNKHGSMLGKLNLGVR